MNKIKEKAEGLDLSYKRIGMSALIGLLFTLVALAVVAMFVSSGKISSSGMHIWAYACVGFGMLIASVLSSGKRKKIIAALLACALVFVVLIMLGILFFPGGFSFKSCAIVLIISAVSCIIGSVISSFIK